MVTINGNSTSHPPLSLLPICFTEAVLAWKGFFEDRYPGLKVVAASTRGLFEGGEEAGDPLLEEPTRAGRQQGSSSAPGTSSAPKPSDGKTGAAGSVDRGAATAILKAVLGCHLRGETSGSNQRINPVKVGIKTVTYR